MAASLVKSLQPAAHPALGRRPHPRRARALRASPLGLFVSYLGGLDLLLLMILIGAFEFLRQLEGRRLAELRAALGERFPLGREEWEHFGDHTAPMIRGRRNAASPALRAGLFAAMEKEADKLPMTPREAAVIGGVYLFLDVALAFVLACAGGIPGVGDPVELLR